MTRRKQDVLEDAVLVELEAAADHSDATVHFTEPASSPCTKYRWNAKNTTSGIASDTNAAGAMMSMFDPNSVSWEKMATVIGCVLRPNVNATIRSFHVQRNWKIASDAIAGNPSGRIRRRKIQNSDAPSIRADSRMSFGIPMKKLRNRKIANGSPNAVWKSTRPRTVSKSPSLL